MADPDISHEGWAVGGPGSRVRRRRNPLWGLLALVLIAGGAAASGWGIWLLATEVGIDEDEILVRGRAAALGDPPTPAVAFISAEGGRHTVYLHTGNLPENRRDTVIAGLACTVTRPDGTEDGFQGNRQGASLVAGAYASVGQFGAGAGENTVACRHVVFGARRVRDTLREERTFVVVAGGTAARSHGFWYLFGGLTVLVPGLMAGVRWQRGSLRRTRDF